MRHRIHFPEAITAGAVLAVRGDEFHHAARVVRVGDGEEVELFDGHGAGARGVVVALGTDHFDVRVDELLPSRESALAVTLAMSVIQLDKFELVLQKAVELGVVAVVPIVPERAEVRPERYRGKGERWEKIVLEAVKQSGRSVIPPIEAPVPFDAAAGRDGARIVFDAAAGGTPLPDSLMAATLFVGPEGGFTPRELALARDRGCLFASLGPRRLRAETAAITACALMAARYGDLR